MFMKSFYVQDGISSSQQPWNKHCGWQNVPSGFPHWLLYRLPQRRDDFRYCAPDYVLGREVKRAHGHSEQLLNHHERLTIQTHGHGLIVKLPFFWPGQIIQATVFLQYFLKKKKWNSTPKYPMEIKCLHGHSEAFRSFLKQIQGNCKFHWSACIGC